MACPPCAIGYSQVSANFGTKLGMLSAYCAAGAVSDKPA